MLNSQLEQHLELFNSGVHDEISEAPSEKLPDERDLPVDGRKSEGLTHLPDHSKRVGLFNRPQSIIAASFVGAFLALKLEVTRWYWIFGCVAFVLSLVLFREVAARWKRSVMTRRATLAKETRRRLSKQIGSIGAPMLGAATDFIPSEKQLVRLEEMSRAHCEWITVADQVMKQLRQATSIKLGLGLQSKCVARVERAFVGRHKRHHPEFTPISLSKVRESLYGALMKHNNMLFALVERQGTLSLHERHPKDAVLTLALLHDTRQESLDLFVDVLNRGLDGFLDETEMFQLDLVWQTCRESQSYFGTWLCTGSIDDSAMSVSSKEISNSLGRTHVSLEGMRSAILGCQEVLRESNGLHTDHFETYWDEVKAFLNEMAMTVDSIDNHYLMEEEATRDSILEPHSESGQPSRLPSVEAGEYNAGDSSFDVNFAEAPRDSSMENKILVYAGKGSAAVSKRRRGPESRSDRPAKALPAINIATEQQLLHELQRRLRALPSVEEVDANSSSLLISYDAEGAAETEVEQATTGTELSGILDSKDGFGSSQRPDFSSSFLSELKGAIPAPGYMGDTASGEELHG